MTRVSTTGNYQSALLNLMTAQQQQADASNRVSTQKIATDLTGFGRGAETLTAFKAAESRVQGFLDTGEVVTARLDAQDLALNQIADAITAAREAVASVLASDSTATLRQDMEGQFMAVANGLNARHQGGYLFAGADTTKAPVSVTTLSDLASVTVASVFNNDQIRAVSRVAENTSVETGYLADEFIFDEPPPVVAPAPTESHVLQIFKDIYALINTPLPSKPTQAQKDELAKQLKRLDAAGTVMIDAAARNGALQKRMEQITLSHEAQKLSLDELVSDRTDADLAKAVTDLELSQIAVQASAQVVSQLREVSLLNYLR